MTTKIASAPDDARRMAIETFCLAVEEHRLAPEWVKVEGWEFRPAFCYDHQRVTARYVGTDEEQRRAQAESMAQDIAWLPGMYRHWIGDDDQILDRDGGLTGYRVTDFIPEPDLAAYRAWCAGAEMLVMDPDDSAPDLDVLPF